MGTFTKISSYWKSQSAPAKTAIVVVGLGLVFSAGQISGLGGSSFFQASLLGGDQPAPFDGTVYPLAETLNWVKLSNTEYTDFKSGKFTYDVAKAAGKVIPIPEYNTEVLKNDPAKLTWKGADLDKRNTLLTFVTAYMGAYTSGSEPAIEYAGSHLAIDIRAALGTPILSVANGKVVKIKDDNTNGKLVVIEYPNVPSVDDASKKVTYYGNYLHLSAIEVVEGQVVTKGQKIGAVGNTGIATTYHLHFQMDKDKAPFHPFWPFTWSDAQAAGLDFFSGVNKGLGKDKAIEYTISPFEWIHKYKNYSGGSTASTPSTTPTTPTSTNTTIPTTTNNETVALNLISDRQSMGAEQSATISVTAVDKDGKTVASFNDPVSLTTNPGAKGTLSTTSVSTFSNGIGNFSYTGSEREEVTITATSGSLSKSVQLTVNDRISEVAKFSLSYPTSAKTGESIPVSIKSLDTNGNLTPSGLTDAVIIGVEGGEGEFTKSILSFQDFTSGEAKTTFKATKAGTIALVARSGTMSGTGPILTVSSAVTASSTDSLFSDVTSATPHHEAISYLKAKNIIEGYPDGTFKPEATVNRAEIIKIILGGSGVSAKEGVTVSPFPDVPASAWFGGWVDAAKDRKIVSGNPDGSFEPSTTVNKAAALKILLLTNNVDLSSMTVSSAPFADVLADDWFALYFQYAKDKNLLEADTSNKISPSAGMTRGEVAEIIYRLMRIKETGANSYSATSNT